MRYLIVIAALLLGSAARAQESTPNAAYRQLLSEANDRIVALAGALAEKDKRIAELEKELKARSTRPPDPQTP